MEQPKNRNAAEFLDDDRVVNTYLNLALQEGNQELFLIALGNIARAKGMSQLSEETGITRDGLYKALSPTGNPSFSTLTKVLNALDFEWRLVELDGVADEHEDGRPNAETMAAMRETEDTLSGKIKAKTYKTPDEFFRALDI